MALLTAEQVQAIIDACGQDPDGLTEAFETAFECQVKLAPGHARALDFEELDRAFGGPGLAISLGLGEQGLLWLVPQSLPLPAWCSTADPNDARLYSFARELGQRLLPPTLAVEFHAALPVSDLAVCVKNAEPSDSALMVELTATSGKDAEPVAMAVILPVNAPPRGDLVVDP